MIQFTLFEFQNPGENNSFLQPAIAIAAIIKKINKKNKTLSQF